MENWVGIYPSEPEFAGNWVGAVVIFLVWLAYGLLETWAFCNWPDDRTGLINDGKVFAGAFALFFWCVNICIIVGGLKRIVFELVS